MPTVSVILPFNNASQFLKDSIESILAQTFKNYELVLVNDGSTDGSLEIAERFASQDERIKLISFSINQGLIIALNSAITASSGKFIARMDADDISHPDRIATQVQFLELHPEIGVVGCLANQIDSRGRYIGPCICPESDYEIRWMSMFVSPMIHPAVMMRRQILTNLDYVYDRNYINIEDYDLWIRLLRYTKFWNIQKTLFSYRVHKHSIYSKNIADISQKHLDISLRAVRAELPDCLVSDYEVRNLCRIFIEGFQNKDLKNVRSQLAVTYLHLWDAFISKHNHFVGFKKVQDKVILKASRMTLYPPFQRSMMKSIGRLNSIDNLWLIRFFLSLPSGVFARLNEIAFKRIRA